ncbi:MAG: TIGR02921 family PEP-CTERM protein [Spirulinaceae cyanobacterium]
MKYQKNPIQNQVKDKTPLSLGKRLVYTFYEAIFSLWNLVFLAIVYAGMLPLLAGDMIEALSSGAMRLEIFLTLIGAIAVPTVFTVIGVLAFIKKPVKLIHLFYGVEAPLFLLCLIRLFIIRELTPASHLVMATFFICIMGFFLELMGDYAQHNRFLASLQLAIHSLLLVVGTAIAALIGFYVVPIAIFLWRGFWSFGWVQGLWWMLSDPWRWGNIYEWVIFGPLYLLFISISATVFVLMPLFLINIYIRSGHRILQQFSWQYGKTRTIQGVVAVLGVWFIAFFVLSQQPQVKAFELLAKPAQTDTQKTALLDKSKEIRRGLTNAYLSGYRYLSPVEKSNSIARFYQDLDFSSATAQLVQNSYNNLISPFLYQGSNSDRQKAEKLYEKFFDLPIQKGEKEAIRKALKSTVMVDEAKAGVLNIDEKRVWLRSQDINLTPHKNWADVEIHEVYENQTTDVEEILYYFSLPESAVITGVWLGDTANRDARFTFQVSPRGAAQKVYNSQVKRINPVDPALLEQVGPRNYRYKGFSCSSP